MRQRQIWKPVAIAVLITALLGCLVADLGGTSGHHTSDLAFALLPDAGPLDLLPSGPGHQLPISELKLFYSDPLLSCLTSRGPPVS